ncbi:conserved hypothetical protein [Ricinus communis]|uniref:Uncharacterized protein n=1 Tax=Ricinus communis TaxID=3988 RepID=B9T033_RICCO|nr:conserved hypothetical protein [Ricinus communis]
MKRQIPSRWAAPLESLGAKTREKVAKPRLRTCRSSINTSSYVHEGVLAWKRCTSVKESVSKMIDLKPPSEASLAPILSRLRLLQYQPQNELLSPTPRPYCCYEQQHHRS